MLAEQTLPLSYILSPGKSLRWCCFNFQFGPEARHTERVKWAFLVLALLCDRLAAFVALPPHPEPRIPDLGSLF